MVGIISFSKPIITTNFTASQCAEGFFGFFDVASDATKRGFVTNGTTNLGSWCMYVTGSSASLRCGAGGANSFMYSVDGGAWTTGTIGGSVSDGTMPIFSGLADTAHRVEICCAVGAGVGTGAWTFASGTFLSVTGISPAVDLAHDMKTGTKFIFSDPAFPGKIMSSQRPSKVPADLSNGNLTPNFFDYTAHSSFSDPSSFKIRARCTDIWLFTSFSVCLVSTDGAAGVRTQGTADTLRKWRKVASGLDGTAEHDYIVSYGATVGAGDGNYGCFGVMLGGVDAAYGTLPTTKLAVIYGDSIVHNQANTGQCCGVGDLHIAAAAINRTLGAQRGKDGWNANTLLASLADIYANDNNGIIEDIAVLAIGFNDTATNQTAFTNDYISILNSLLSHMSGPILCRATNIASQQGSGNVDGWIQTAIASVANSRIHYIETSAWAAFAHSGAHPTEAGNITIAANEAVAYAPYF